MQLVRGVKKMEGFARGFYFFSEWVMRFVFVNILWIFFTIVGLFIFGFFPATIAMFSVVRKWVLKESDIPIFKIFWKTYKTEFLKSNVLGLVVTAFSIFMYFNLSVIQATTLPLLKVLFIPNLIVIMIFILTFLYVIPVFVHYEGNLVQVIKNSFFFMLLNPKATFCMIAFTVFLVFILYSFPGLIPFFSGSLLAYILMWFSKYVFVKIDEKQNVVEGSNVTC
jgi:uncharacterized membrane protein YesL